MKKQTVAVEKKYGKFDYDYSKKPGMAVFYYNNYSYYDYKGETAGGYDYNSYANVEKPDYY
jgi:hypothetical protein